MSNLKNLFKNLDKTDLKIMKIGLKICYIMMIFSFLILCYFLFFVHTSFAYNLGLMIFKLSTYFAVEFIVCGVVADTVKKQIS